MRAPRQFIPGFLLSIALSWTALAQPAARPQVGNIEFTALGWEKPLPEILYVSAGKVTAMPLPAFKRSPRQHYTGDATLTFYRKLESPADGNDRHPLGSVTLPEDARSVLLLFIPSGPDGYRILALRENDEAFPPGRARVLNVTGYTVAVKTREGDAVTLDPGEQSLLSGNGQALRLRVAYRDGGEWRRAASNIFSLKPEDRRTIFLASSDDEFFKTRTEDGGLLGRGPLQVFSITE